MSTSQKKGRTASKVLKVALSAALAAAFTPVAAAPAFAAAPTAEQTQTALAAGQAGITNANCTVFVDGSKVYLGYDYGNTGVDYASVAADAAQFVNALYANPGVVNVKYANTTYSWSGSAWTAEGKDPLAGAVGSALATALGASTNTARYASVTLGISVDGTSFSNITLSAQISTAKLTPGDGSTDENVYSLAEALRVAVSGDTVTMTSNTVTNVQLSMNEGVVLEGNYKTLTHLANPSSITDAGQRAAIVFAPGINTEADSVTIRNLKIEGPDTKVSTEDAEGNTVREWTSGEYAIKAYGEGADILVQNVEITRAQSAMQATMGGNITVKGYLKMSNLAWGGIEVSKSGQEAYQTSSLTLDPTASITYAETADKPFAWVHNGGMIYNNAKVSLAKVDKTPANGDPKFHYYLSSADAKGAYFYQPDALPGGNGFTEFSLGSKSEYVMLKVTPVSSGTYFFTSASGDGTDAFAELYSTTSANAMGTKIASGDNEMGSNFQIHANLTGGTTYILRVGISSAADEAFSCGNVEVSMYKADKDDLNSYTVSLPSAAYYYDSDKITPEKLNATVRSAIDGKTLASGTFAKQIYPLNVPGLTDDEYDDPVPTITLPGRYALVITSNNIAGETQCIFDVLDSENIEDYDFKYNNTLVFASGQVASLTNIAPKGYRYGSSTVTFNEADLAVEGWYELDADGEKTRLSTAPSAVGNYVLKLKAADANKYSADGTKELKFSITKGKVTPPAARTGLTYTGSAQQGVPTGANYTLSGTYSATNAGTYSCTATLAEGYSWTDGTTAPKTIAWSIAKAKIAVPTGTANLVYTGKVQTGVTAGTGYTLSGTTTATEPGTYTCTATPTANYAWTDGTSTSKTVSWTLGKAPASITATPSSVVVDAGTKAVVSLKQAGTAAYTVASSNSSVATATVSGSVVTITAKASGSATVTVSTAATTRYAAGTCAITVSVPKAEGATGSITDTVTNADGTTTKVTNKFKVTTAADPDDADVTPTVAFTGTNASGKFTVPSSVTLADGVTYKVTSIASKAFEGEAVTQVTVPSSVTKIGSYAFRNCKKLTKVTIPSSVKEISTSAFYGCSKLTSISVAGGKVGKYAFKNCTKLGSVTLGSKVSSVGADALKGAKATSITIKTSKLSKTSIKNLVKNSKLTTIKCSGVSKKVKANYSTWAKTYKWNVKVQ